MIDYIILICQIKRKCFLNLVVSRPWNVSHVKWKNMLDLPFLKGMNQGAILVSLLSIMIFGNLVVSHLLVLSIF